MKTFVDLGAHYFEGLADFTSRLKIDKTWNVYSFEACKDLYDETQIERAKIEGIYNKLVHRNLAVLDRNGTVTFNKIVDAVNIYTGEVYLGASQGHLGGDRHYWGAANCLEENPTVDNGYTWVPIKEDVGCVDINDIIDEIIENDPSAEIYIKIDIEGSEFKVLPRLKETLHISNIKEIHTEWHHRFWENNPAAYTEKCKSKDDLIAYFESKGIKTFEHY
jgi:hypothetical protein